MQTAQTTDVSPAPRQRRNHACVVEELVNAGRSRQERCVLRAEDLVLLVIE